MCRHCPSVSSKPPEPAPFVEKRISLVAFSAGTTGTLLTFGDSQKQFELFCTPKHTLASFIADDLTYHDDQPQIRCWCRAFIPCPLNEGLVCVCVCVCEEQGSAAHYSSDPLAMTRSVAMPADPHPVRLGVLSCCWHPDTSTSTQIFPVQCKAMQ